jgi:hypothetical protein
LIFLWDCDWLRVDDREILRAIASDPTPLIAREDFNFAEEFSKNNHALLRVN